MYHLETSTAEYIPEAYGGDGYDSMEALVNKGFHIYSSWGKDGWDAGDWPYVQIGLRAPGLARHNGEMCSTSVYETVYYVEGDISIKEFPSREEAIAHLDTLVHWHWNNNSRGPRELDPSNPDHCEPFTRARLDPL